MIFFLNSQLPIVGTNKINLENYAVCLVKIDYDKNSNKNIIKIPVENPRLSFSKLIDTFCVKKTNDKDKSEFKNNSVIFESVKIGNNFIIGNFSVIKSNVIIGNNCFIGHGVMFTNDKFTEDRNEWVERETIIGNNVRIGSNATILPVNIGDNVIIGAGAVVTKDIPSNTIVKGNPAK